MNIQLKRLWLVYVLIMSLVSVKVFAKDEKVKYKNNSDVKAFAKDYAKKHKKDYKQVLAILEQGEYQQSIIDAISRPAEFTMEWKDYSKIFLKEKRLNQGLAFWKKHEKVIAAVSKKYQVEPEFILAIIGVETWYGNHMGNYRVLDALMTLGFNYPKRSSFFSSELEHFLTMTFEQKLDPLKLKGSYAGAMGFGQFIPSSYQAYAKSHDGKGPIDIWEDEADAIASVANYLHVHKWRYGDLVALQLTGAVDDKLETKGLNPDKTLSELKQKGVNIPETLSPEAKVTLMKMEGSQGAEYWLGFHNFYVITRYNRSTLYTMAVFQLAQLLKYEMNLVK